MLSFYKAMKENPFDYIPMTFHIQHGENDAEFIKFATMFSEIEKTKQPENMHNLWIIKPGENSNRGQGISVCNNLYQIKSLVSTSAYGDKTFIIQKYIEKPFLIHKRKFDFRCYSLITSINGVIQGYFYSDGYIRTASCEFSVKDTSNNFMHLTNDAIQKHCEDYGKFEDGNKLSYKDFQRYLDFHCSERKINFIKDVLPQIKKLTKDTMKAVYFKIDPNRRIHCMEVFGYDFMLDKNAKVWLIEVNTNPCLELSSNYLSILIPAMVENAFKIVLDPLFPPPFGKVGDVLIDNKFELIFHQATDAEEMINELGDRINLLQEENQISEEEEELFSDEDFDMGLNKGC
jgi:tubulin monoglycylase TTLL3/8